ncbi:MAG: glycosyltransferase [Lachnospiraceae bacterium]|nr:glycosyltransferase [Lachnospiraceae bacterium]
MKDVKVSIVMPVYNAAAFLEESISDLLAQTYTDFELICVNDGSTDDSKRIIDGFAGKDNRIRLISQENRGGGAARNSGYDETSGEYILFLDADDRFEKDLIEKTVTVAEQEQCDVLIFAADEFHFDTGKKRPAPWLLQSGYDDYDGNPFHYTTSTVWNKLYRREFLIDNSIRFMDERVIADAMYFVFFALAKASRISFLDDVLIHYRSMNPHSTTSRHDSRPLDILTVLETIWNRVKDDEELLEKKSIYINFAVKYLFERMGWFKSCDGLSQVYNALHSDGFSRIGLTEDNDRYIEDINWKNLKNRIIENDLPEYLFFRDKSYKSKGLLTKTVYLLPDEIQNKLGRKDCTVALYGAGMVGKCYFPQLQSIPTAKVVTWVDAKYDVIGYPLQSPEVLKDTVVDYIVIGIEHNKFLSEIEEKLGAMGIAKEKILWAVPEKQL